MEVGSAFASGGIVATVLGVVLVVYKSVNHQRIKSKCCGKRCDVSLDIESTEQHPSPVVVTLPTEKKSAPDVNGEP